VLGYAHLAAKHLGDARAGATWQEQQHALPLSGGDRGCTAETERDLGAIGFGVVDRHLQTGTLGLRHIAAGRPFQIGLRGFGQYCRSPRAKRESPKRQPRN
jgi:hypothetical protein